MQTTGWTVQVERYWGLDVIEVGSRAEARELAKRIAREQDRVAKAVFVR